MSYAVAATISEGTAILRPRSGIGEPPPGPRTIHNVLVAILRHYPGGLTSGEMRAVLQRPPFSYTAQEQTQVDRRMRELCYWFPVTKINADMGTRYQL
ncbi:MAG TPA: hypothetical protein VGD01_02175 [Candidatus Elarobacter sp.]|jgi:hypothetical protein